MSKYIIELDDRIKLVTSVGVTENGVVYTTSDYVHNLEELNSDYINEHFGDLQDTAYQKGINDGSLDVKQRVEGAYQKGFEDGKAVHDKGCEGCLYNDRAKEHSPCDICCNAYLNRWTAKPQEDDKIEVGDIVERYLNGKLDSTGIYLGEDGDYWNCLFWTGAVFGTFAYPKNQFKKTGRHVDIDKILEDMRND